MQGIGAIRAANRKSGNPYPGCGRRGEGTPWIIRELEHGYEVVRIFGNEVLGFHDLVRDAKKHIARLIREAHPRVEA